MHVTPLLNPDQGPDPEVGPIFYGTEQHGLLHFLENEEEN
jgi:hypothetical protein